MSASRVSRPRMNPETQTNVRRWPIFAPTRRHGFLRGKCTVKGYSSDSMRTRFAIGKSGTACGNGTQNCSPDIGAGATHESSTPDEGYPGIRYVLLHTVAHLLIRELGPGVRL